MLAMEIATDGEIGAGRIGEALTAAAELRKLSGFVATTAYEE